jgi:pimeloyl-ACP methyl ester carboxylesterase
LQAGDVITAVGDRPVSDVGGFVATVAKLRAGDAVDVHLRRGAQDLSLKLGVKPRPFESSPDADVSYASVEVDGSLRRVIVTQPKQAGRHPAVLYLTGIGCFSQESLGLVSSESKLLYGLTRAGFVTLRVEKSGMGDSQGAPCPSPAVDLQAEVRGYVAGLKALAQYPSVDKDKLFILGLSVGGIEAPLVAQQAPVRGLVVVNTVAKPFLEYLMDTRRRQLTLGHVADDEMEQRLALNELCNHRLLIEKQSPDEVTKARLDCGDLIAYPAPYTYMQQWAALNPAAEWKKVDAPVLVVYGESDYVSTVADDPYLAALIDSFHPKHATLQAIPGMDHNLTRAASMEESLAHDQAGTPEEFDPAVLDAIQAWLLRQAGAPPASAS